MHHLLICTDSVHTFFIYTVYLYINFFNFRFTRAKYNFFVRMQRNQAQNPASPSRLLNQRCNSYFTSSSGGGQEKLLCDTISLFLSTHISLQLQKLLTHPHTHSLTWGGIERKIKLDIIFFQTRTSHHAHIFRMSSIHWQSQHTLCKISIDSSQNSQIQISKTENFDAIFFSLSYVHFSSTSTSTPYEHLFPFYDCRSCCLCVKCEKNCVCTFFVIFWCLFRNKWFFASLHTLHASPVFYIVAAAAAIAYSSSHT
jgi:hypothetical protein